MDTAANWLAELLTLGSHWLAELLTLGSQHKDDVALIKDIAELLIAYGTLIGALIWAAVGLRRWLTKPKQPDPKLSAPPLADRSLTRYSARAVELLGREDAMARLQAFLQSGGGFAWMQIAGVGGQGKSRLGYELTLWAQDQGWEAGLLETADLAAFAQHWASWRPRRPHLLVLDYVIGRESEIKGVIQTLAGRAEDLRWPVRLLLLERQRWDRGGLGGIGRAEGPGPALSAGSEGRAEWFLRLAERHDGNDPRLESTRFEDGVLELERLDEADLIDIVRRIAGLEGVEIGLADPAIAGHLRRIDGAGRPLYAYFLGQALAAGSDPSGGPSGKDWRRDDLLRETLDRDQRSRWRRVLGDEAPCLGDNSPAERLAVIATIGGGLDCAAAARQGLIPHADANTRHRALVLADGPLGSGASGPSQHIPALQPDLLGEWFVLGAFADGLPQAEVLDLAWRHAPDPTAAFLSRLSQDFPDHPVTAELLDRSPPDADAAFALAKVAFAIIVNLHRARHPFPKTIMDALVRAATSGDARAMYGLGYCFWAGQGVERDLEQSVAWYRKGAEAGDGGAMANLGVCYEQGLGVERDLEQAVAWYRKGAEAGDGGAMANLGSCYSKGLGVERDLEQAVAWYRKGAEAGDGRAMANLGFYYSNGQGVERDLVQALAWFRKGAETGNHLAMVALGACYQGGKGVERDLEQALTWYRKGAEAGGGLAMAILGDCYQNGQGVERDLEQAVAWYRKGAEAGDGRAMTDLGFCYQNGQGVERDLEQAVTWCRKGAEAGGAQAMANLGFCYQNGQGVERDLEQAVAWYRKGAEAGSDFAATQLRNLLAAQGLVTPRGEPDPEDDTWAQRRGEELGSAPWLDAPPTPGDWQDLTGHEALSVLTRLRPQLGAFGLTAAPASLSLQRLRAAPLPFYRDCTLVDIQLQRHGHDGVELVSALVAPTGAALLDGTSPLLVAINPQLLALGDDALARAYLRFFCAFFRGQEGPFDIVEAIDALPMGEAQRAALAPEVRDAIAPLRAIDGSLEQDACRRFHACVLHSNALFRGTFKVLATGMVEMEEEQPIAADLPVRRRRYEGIFRTPLRDATKG